MKSITMVMAAVLLGAGATAMPAHAVGGGVNLGNTGTAYIAETYDLAPLTGLCKYANHSAGVGGSGITYEIAGEGSATGTYKGIPVVATGVRCRFYIAGVLKATSGPEFLPGSASATNTSYSTTDARGGVACVTVYGVLRQIPPGETDNQIETKEQC